MSPSSAALQRLLSPVEVQVEAMREVINAELRADSGAVADMTAHIGRFRGKQLRGTLVLLAGAATGNEDPELPSVAAIVEMIHLATLVHDDVLDGAGVRRRVASVNRRWDNQVAVLLGDLLYARAFGLSTRLESRVTSRVLSETTREICAGEIDQAVGRYDFEASQLRYEAIASAKTAALYGAAAELGACSRAHSSELGRELKSFGREVGLAFQIVDDVLDVVGNQEVVGKSVGNDVADGKVTLPVLHVYGESDEDTRARIRDAYTLPGLEDRAGHLREVCDLQPGVEFALARAESLVETARGRLSRLSPSPARDSLGQLLGFVLLRKW